MGAFDTSTPNGWIAAHQRLRALAHELRDSARGEDWSQLDGVASEQVSLVALLGNRVPPSVIAQVGADVAAAWIQELATINDEVIARLEAQQREIGSSLRQLENTQSNVSRLSKAYRA
jgi:hypothetical protein